MTHGTRTELNCLQDVFKALGKKPIECAQPLDCIVMRETPFMARTIADARRDMGEARWSELNAEWLA